MGSTSCVGRAINAVRFFQSSAEGSTGLVVSHDNHDDSLFTDWTKGLVGIPGKHQFLSGPVDRGYRGWVGDTQTSDEF